MPHVDDRQTAWRDAFRSLESELCDARNMASLTSDIADSFPPDGEVLIFAICHTEKLVNNLHEKWTRLIGELAEQNVREA